MNEIKVGQTVKRINSGYDTGKVGQVVEVAPMTNRARVLWTVNTLGQAISKPIRTWVNFRFLTTITS